MEKNLNVWTRILDRKDTLFYQNAPYDCSCPLITLIKVCQKFDVDRLGLVIESNHERTVAVLVRDETLCTLPIAAVGSLNHHTGIGDQVNTAYHDLLLEIARELQFESIEELSVKLDFALICLPGGATIEDLHIVRSIVVRCGWQTLKNIFVIDDTWAAAAAVGQSCIVGIADAGASVFVHNGRFQPGRTAKFDGWGPILGDFGGAIQLAIDTLRLCCRELDSNRQLPILVEILSKHQDIANSANLQQWFDGIMNRHVSIWLSALASVGQTIIRAVSESPGSHNACHLLVEKSASEFAQTILMAHRTHMPDTRDIPVVLYGSMLSCPIYCESLREALKPLGTEFTSPKRSILYGSLIMALAGSGEEATLDCIRRSEEDLNSMLANSLDPDLEILMSATQGHRWA